YMIEGTALAAQQHGQVSVIADVFDIYMDAASGSSRANRQLLPVRTKEALATAKQSGDESDSMCARIIADAICMMTEDEIVRLYARLKGVSLGSVLDAIV